MFSALIFLVVVVALMNGAQSRNCPDISVLPSLNGNVSIDDNGAYYSFRAAVSTKVSLPHIGGLGVYSSIAVSAGSGGSSGGASFDLLTGRLTAQEYLIPPTASLAWFNTAANYVFNLNQTDISGNTNAGVFSSALNTIFLKVFEYADLNGNGVYDANSSDVIVSQVNLNNFNQQGLSEVLWDDFCGYSSSDNPLVIYNLTNDATSSTNGFTFGIQTTLSEVVGVTSEGQLLTPRSMKIDILVQNYPYEGYQGQQNTKLALHTIVASAQANATASAAFGVNSISTGLNNTQLTFSWNAQAQVGGNPSASVSATGFGQFTSTSDLGLAAFIFFGAGASASADFKQVFFSFDGVQPNYVYWDPMISSGPAPQVSSNSNNSVALAVGLGVGLGLAGLIAVGAGVFFCIRSKKLKQTQSLVSDDHLSGANYNTQA